MTRNEQLLEYRIERGIAWERFSDMMGIKHPVLFRSLTGKTTPHETTERKIQRWYTRNRADIEAALAELEPITVEGCRDARHAHK